MPSTTFLLITFWRKAGGNKHTLALDLGTQKLESSKSGDLVVWKNVDACVPISKQLHKNGNGDWDQIIVEHVTQSGIGSRGTRKVEVREVVKGPAQRDANDAGDFTALITFNNGGARSWFGWNNGGMINAVGVCAPAFTSEGEVKEYNMGPDYGRITDAIDKSHPSQPSSVPLSSLNGGDTEKIQDFTASAAKNKTSYKTEHNTYYQTSYAYPHVDQLEALIAMCRMTDRTPHAEAAKTIENFERHLPTDEHLANAVGFAVEPLAQPTFQQAGASRKDIAAENTVDKYGAELVLEFEANHHRIPSSWNYIDAGIFARFVKKSKDYFLSSDVINSPIVKSKLLGSSASQGGYIFNTRDGNGNPIPGKTVVIGQEELPKILAVEPTDGYLSAGGWLDNAKAWVKKKYAQGKRYYNEKIRGRPPKSKTATKSKTDEEEGEEEEEAPETLPSKAGHLAAMIAAGAGAGESRTPILKMEPTNVTWGNQSSTPIASTPYVIPQISSGSGKKETMQSKQEMIPTAMDWTTPSTPTPTPTSTYTPPPTTIAEEYEPSSGIFKGFAKHVLNSVVAPSDPLKGKKLSVQDVQEYENLLLEAYSASPTRHDFEEWCHQQPVDKLYKVNQWMRHLIALYYSMNLSRYETRFTVEELAQRINTANKKLYPPQKK